MAEPLIVSIDWGGSKAAGMICNPETGLSRKIESPSPNLRLAKEEAIEKTLLVLLSDLEKGKRIHLFVGAAGARPEYDQERIRTALARLGIHPERLQVIPDYLGNLAAGLNGADGLLSVNGTGSVLFGRAGTRDSRRGGWGGLLDETPSGAWFGRLVARAVLAAWEGSRETQHVADLYAEQFPGKPQDRASFLTAVYASDSWQTTLGGLAPVFAAAVRCDSAWARECLTLSLEKWARDLVSLADELGLSHPVSYTGVGGLWRAWPEFASLARGTLEIQYPGVMVWRDPVLPLELGPARHFLEIPFWPGSQPL